MSKSRSGWLRILLLIGLMGGLGVVAYRQYAHQQAVVHQNQAVFEQYSQSLPESPQVEIKPREKSLSTLLVERRPEAEAARDQITALLTERKNESRVWPTLLVPKLPSAKTRDTIQKDYLQYRLRELAAYQQHTEDTGAAKAAGEAFLDAYLRHAVDREQSQESDRTLMDLGQAALDAGSRDPLLRTYITYCQQQVTPDAASAIREWEGLLDELPKTKYPRIVASYAGVFIRDYEPDLPERMSRWKQALPRLVEWLEEEAESPEWLASTSRRVWALWEQSNQPERGHLAAACMKSSKMDPYFPHTMAGMYLVKEAWRARGGGWAKDVTPRGWKVFDENLKTAMTHLEYAWTLHPELPQAPEQMITVAMANETEGTPYFWFLQTIRAQFDFHEAYSALALSLTSRWSGSRKELYAFGTNCVETLRFDTLVPYQALEVIRHVQELELDEGERLADDPGAKKLLRRFMELRQSFLSDPARPKMYEDSGRYRAELIAALEETELFDESANVLRQSEGNLSWTRLRSQNQPGRFLAVRRLALQSPLGARVRAFDQKLQAPWNGTIDPKALDDLEAELQSLQTAFGDAPNLKDDVPDYFAHARVMLKQQRGYNSGEWFDLEQLPGLPGWEPYVDRWDFHADSGTILRSLDGAAKQIMLRPLTRFPAPLEVECDVDHLEPPPYLKRAGVGWSREGMASTKEVGEGLVLFNIVADRDPYLQDGRTDRHDFAGIQFAKSILPMSHPIQRAGTQRIRVKLWPDEAEYTVENGFFAARLPGGLHSDGWLCFGEHLPTWQRDADERGSVRFQNIRVRRLAIASPPPMTASLAERAQYWEQRFTAEPENVLCNWKLAGIRGEQRRFPEAMTLIDALLERAPQTQGLRRCRALLLTQQGRYAEALADHEQVRVMRYNDMQAIWRHADLLATAPDDQVRNGSRALETADFILKYASSFADRHVYQAVASAYAELGDFNNAIDAQQRAMDSDAEVADALSAIRLEQYRAGKPWRHPETAVAP